MDAYQKLGLILCASLCIRLSLFKRFIDCNCSMFVAQRVMRPRGGINEWLHWLPISVHKKLDLLIKKIFGDSSRKVEGKNGMPLLTKKTGNTC